jgi:acetylornithine aminotransferase
VRVIDFGIGEPREETPAFIRRALADALEPVSTYPRAEGLPVLREAVAGWVARRFGVRLDPATQVVPTLGAKEAIFHLAQVVGPGKVAVTVPGYPVAARGALFAGREVVELRSRRPRVPARPRRGAVGRARAPLAQLPQQPDGGRRPRPSTPRRRRGRARTASSSRPTRRTPSCGSPGRRPRARCRRRPAGVLALNTLSKRSSMPGYRSGFVAGDPS